MDTPIHRFLISHVTLFGRILLEERIRKLVFVPDATRRFARLISYLSVIAEVVQAGVQAGSVVNILNYFSNAVGDYDI